MQNELLNRMPHSDDNAPVRLGSPAGDGTGRTLTKAELADILFDRLGLNKREAKEMVDDFFDELRLALERGARGAGRPRSGHLARHRRIGRYPRTRAR